ncbi:MAG TPA: ABC transporter permease [Jatrophihabitantaceae bacterium]
MLKSTLRGMLAHRLRLALTTAAITLGVAFLAGTLILTDTMSRAFDQLYSKVSAGTDVAVREHAAYGTTDGEGASHSPVSAAVLPVVRQVPGVRAADGTVSGYALITDAHGHAILPGAGADTHGGNWVTDDGLRGDVRLRDGHAPTSPHDVVIDAASADAHHIAIGSRINVLFHGPTQRFTLVGTAMFGGEKSLGGGTTAYFATPTAQRVLGVPGTFDQINASADPGISEGTLAARIQAVLPHGAEAVTGTQLRTETSDNIHASLKFVTVLFSVFAGIALFVGSFIIWNTFTMTVAQRSREIALLRAVGATRGQVRRSLLVEALLLGLGASTLGLAVGIGVAKGLSALMTAIGFDLPTTSSVVQPRTVWLALAVGTVVTLVAALAPARRATKVLPVQALQDAAADVPSSSRVRAVAGVLIFVAGLAALYGGLFLHGGITQVGLGTVAVVLGVTTLGPLAVRPLAAVVGAPLRARGVIGQLAQQNATRNPRRTSSTAAALMIGLALVVSVGVFATSLKAVFGKVLGDSTNADLYIAPASVSAPGFSTDVMPTVAKVPGVRLATANGFGAARFAGSDGEYAAVDPNTAESALNLDVTAGTARDLGTDGVLVARKTAKAHGWTVGSSVPTQFASTGSHPLHVVGIYDRTTGYISQSYVVSIAAQAAYDGTRLDSGGVVILDKGANRDTVETAIKAALTDHPDARVLTPKEFEAVAAGLIDKLQIFINVMLLMAVVIALLGIVNTLALSVFERTRELGLLRAIGMTPRQLRAMIRGEAVVISLIGAVAGAGLGMGLGAALVRALRDQGFTKIAIPGTQVLMYLGLAAVAGVIAAMGPARSAGKVDVLKAVVTD